MKIGVAALVGGLLGVPGFLCFLLAFGTDYWLLAHEDCVFKQPRTTTYSVAQINSTEASEVEDPNRSFLTLHHEGFFWRCLFQHDSTQHLLLAVLFTNQPRSKECIQGYLFPLPVAVGPVPHNIYDATAVFRGFWTVLIILAVVASVTGGFLLVCAVPFISQKLYRVGGAFLITAGCLFLVLVGLFILWKELVDVRQYILQERGRACPDAHLEAQYGWSFIVAVAGIPLILLSGLLFYCIGRYLQRDI
ncbi:transmembrane protein 182 isoform X1 [Ictalurus punctatus]|uniref:Transmembrane protein 182 isoform X1 n=1 Tax=Ictalurus punctatus TaxID=7998 RepID=A0A2D0RIG4_ICTPU|nr:transmembrane protein 182 isoform X1 [Ictalurus punctatus]